MAFGGNALENSTPRVPEYAACAAVPAGTPVASVHSVQRWDPGKTGSEAEPGRTAAPLIPHIAADAGSSPASVATLQDIAGADMIQFIGA